MGKKITATQAYDRGLVTDVFPESEFSREVARRIAEMAALPTKVKRYFHVCFQKIKANYGR